MIAPTYGSPRTKSSGIKTSTVVQQTLTHETPPRVGSGQDEKDEQPIYVEAKAVPSQPKKFTITPMESVTKEALAQGFSWSLKQQTRPGQFSSRSRPGNLAMHKLNFHNKPSALDSVATQRYTIDQLQKSLPTIVPKTVVPTGTASNKPGTYVRLTDSPGSLQGEAEAGISSGPKETINTTCKHHVNSNQADLRQDTNQLANALGYPSMDISRRQGDIPRDFPANMMTESREGAARSHNELKSFKNTMRFSRSSSDCQSHSTRDSRLHTKKRRRSSRQRSSSSLCGDLERPVPQSAKKRIAENSEGRSGSFQRSPEIHLESPASNISRKRIRVEKRRSKSETHYKKLIMQQVAQYWNECIRVIEEEKECANWEIEKLQENIRFQDRKLKDSESTAKKRELVIEETENQRRKFEALNSQASQVNQKLELEIQSLQQQLADSSKGNTEIAEKYRVCRSKLNEAIEEQHTLHQRARTFYDKMMTKLQDDNKKPAISSESIERAIAIGQAKRKEMQECLAELKRQTNAELDQSECSIHDAIKIRRS